ncbi:PPC domain-containing protein [Polyangium sp. 6x1]|uniref:PPC domain-containing protein n=1 Tax=Polyangium sp. 6x1 TaxID=3042689 RepID=UPI002482CBCC|nr:PPC domain-containing protein [Polyangium sp. 6x1]MDI1443859.1 PPC domain-containing protein [Polyangium sp. 6x1]
MIARREWSYFVVMALAAMTHGCQGEQGETGMDDAADSTASEADTSADSEDTEPADVSDEAALPAAGSLPEALGSAWPGASSLEPNEASVTAKDAPLGVTNNLSITKGDEDWYRVVVPARTVARVGIEMNHAAGDLDLVAYDAQGRLLGSRNGAEYPYTFRGQETNTEYYGFYSEDGGAVYYVRVLGHAGATNKYSLRVDHYSYVDGQTCTGAGFSLADCDGRGSSGSGLIPFPFPDPSDSLGNAYNFASYSNYRFARRELVMLVRHALAETREAFPGTKPLSLIDICQMDGVTPGYDIGDPRHPQSTHDQGGNIDIAYFQTDGANDAEIVCNDGASHADGYCTSAAAKKHIVDLPRQAFFMAKLFASSRTRVIGTDTVLAPLIRGAAQALAALPAGDRRKISQSELSAFSNRLAYGSGWPYHHHHIHLSLQWLNQGNARAGEATALSAPAPFLGPGAQDAEGDPKPQMSNSMQAPGEAVDSLDMAWPPRP